jgi:hypothetical protein
MRFSFRAPASALVVAGLVAALAAGTVSAVGPSPDPAIPATDSARCARPAQGEGVDSVGNLRSFGACEIHRRLALLERLAGRVAHSATLTGADRTALSGEIASTTAGLTALGSTIANETVVAALKADIQKIATDYRVYVLVEPKTRLVIAADRLSAGYDRFATVEQRLAASIAAAKVAGKDVTQAQAAYDAMVAKVGQAEGLLGPVVGTILPLTPAGWNAGTAKPVLESARSTLRQVSQLFAGARADARQCVQALRAQALHARH